MANEPRFKKGDMAIAYMTDVVGAPATPREVKVETYEGIGLPNDGRIRGEKPQHRYYVTGKDGSCGTVNESMLENIANQ